MRPSYPRRQFGPKTQVLRQISRLDTKTLRPGLYAAQSTDPAYADLLAATMWRRASLRGQRDTLPGVSVIVVEVRRPVRRGIATRANGAEVRQMSIGAEYLQTAKRDYANWRETWWREAIQNSVDAGARNVSCEVTRNSDGTWRVTCEDDGRGMDEETLTGKFMRLGGSGKRDEGGSTGGFGKAKELLLLPWLSYEIHSRSVLVVGAGTSYRVEAAQDRQGTRLTVTMAADDKTSDVNARSFISKCYLPRVAFTVNGDPLSALMRSRRPVEETDDVAIYFNKDVGPSGSRMYVRTNGLCMYDQWLDSSVNGNVIVELKKPSIEVLTANRDGIRDRDLRRFLEQFTSRLASDRLAALRTKKRIGRQIFRGDGRIKTGVAADEGSIVEELLPMERISSSTRSEPGEEVTSEEAASASQGRLFRELADREIEAAKDSELGGSTISIVSTASANAAMVTISSTELLGPNHAEAVAKQLAWRPDFVVDNEVEDFRVPSSLLPQRMSAKALFLARVWAELVRFVLIQLGSRADYGIGWVIDEQALAAYLESDGHWVMLNPYADPVARDAILDPRDPKVLKQLVALAIHECTHFHDGVSTHDVTFAYAMTKNMGKCAAIFREADRLVKALKIRKAGEIKLDRLPQLKKSKKTSEIKDTRRIVDGVYVIDLADSGPRPAHLMLVDLDPTLSVVTYNRHASFWDDSLSGMVAEMKRRQVTDDEDTVAIVVPDERPASVRALDPNVAIDVHAHGPGLRGDPVRVLAFLPSPLSKYSTNKTTDGTFSWNGIGERVLKRNYPLFIATMRGKVTDDETRYGTTPNDPDGYVMISDMNLDQLMYAVGRYATRRSLNSSHTVVIAADRYDSQNLTEDAVLPRGMARDSHGSIVRIYGFFKPAARP